MKAIVLGPCGDPALIPEVEIRRVGTVDGDRVEIALLSEPYGWRVRSWWTPAQARDIAERIVAAASSGDQS